LADPNSIASVTGMAILAYSEDGELDGIVVGPPDASFYPVLPPDTP
jgi:hypothetical protein